MTSTLFQAFLSRLFFSGCTVLSAFVSLKLYTIFLTKDIYGVLFVSTQIISYLPLTGAGFVGVLNQRILTERDPEAAARLSWFAQFLQNCVFLIALVVALILMAGFAETSLAKSSGLPATLFCCIGLAGALTFYVSGQFSFLIGLGEQTKCYLLQGTLQLLTSLVLFLAFLGKLGAWAFPVSSALSALLLFLPLRFILRSRLKGLPLFVLKRLPDYKERFLAVWRPAVDNLMIQGWGLLNFTFDGILVGFLAGPEQAALYGVISRLTYTSRHVMQALGEAAWPRLAQHTDPVAKAQFMRKVDRLSAWNVGTWFGAMFATVVPFLGWCLKSDWVAGQTLIALIFARHALISLTGPHVFGIISLGLFRELARLCRQEALLGLVLGAAIGVPWGTTGIATGYLIGSCVVSGWQFARAYFTAQHQPWASELSALYLRFVIGAGLSWGLGMLFWQACRMAGMAPGWMAIVAGALAFGLSWGFTGGIGLLRARRQR